MPRSSWQRWWAPGLPTTGGTAHAGWSRRTIGAALAVALLASLVVGLARPAAAANPMGTKVSGQNVSVGEADPFTKVSRDNGSTWQPAYVAGGFGSHPWDAGGTNSWGLDTSAQWINCTTSFFDCINETVTYRTTVVLADSGPLSLTFHVLADNAATPYINGEVAGPRFVGTLDDGTVEIDPSLLRHGVNTFDMVFEDQGGWAGFRYDLVGTLGNQAPEITTAPDRTVNAVSASGASLSYATPTANDVEDGPLAVSCTPASGSVFPLGATTVSCSATDSGSKTATTTFTVNVRDVTGPVISAPSGFNLPGNTFGGRVVTWSVSAYDAVSGPVGASCSPPSGSLFPVGTRTVSCNAFDAAGNGSTRTFTVTVTDTAGPVLVLPASFTVEATAPATQVFWSSSATDVVSGARPVFCDRNSGAGYLVGTYPTSCSSVDPWGNRTYGSFTFSVVDTTKPVLALPETIVSEAVDAGGAAVTYSATATDSASGVRATSCSVPSGSQFAIGTTTVTCTASDPSGNVATGSFQVVVRDTIAPVVQVATSVEAEGNVQGGARVTYGSSASDAVSGSVAVSCEPASGSTFPVGATTGTCTATDEAGNIGLATFTVLVRDTTSPVIIVPGTLAVPAVTDDGAPVTFAASASDVVDGDITPICSATSGEVFALGATTVTCAAEDLAGNGASASFDIQVFDVLPPVLSLPQPIVLEATGPGTPVLYAATAFDAVSGDRPVSCSIPSGTALPLGTVLVSCTAADTVGNLAHGAFAVEVRDTTAPLVGFTAGDLRIEGDELGGARVTFASSAVDAVWGSLEPSCSAASGDLFPVGSSDITCVVFDGAGNLGSATLHVTITDTTAPLLLLSGDIVEEALGADGAPVAFSASAADVVDGPLVPACDATSGQTFPLGATTVACSAADAQGNTAGGDFQVTVRDTTAPVVTAPASRTVEATGPDGAAVAFAATATDAVDADPVIACSQEGTFGIGTTTVVCTATDDAGNVGSASFDVTVVDTTAPELTVPADIVAEATSASGAVVGFTATATDVVGVPAPTCVPAAGTTFALGTTTVTCTVADAAGNRASGTFTVEVLDRIAPVVTFTGNRGTYGILEQVDIACSVSDAVTSLTCAGVTGSAISFGHGGETVTRSATDDAGNVGRATTTFTVKVTTGDLCTLVGRYLAGEAGAQGVSNSLCAKLRSGAYADFRSEVRAQSGKKLTADEATTLTALSGGLV